jgi:hypothetical protein
LANIAAESLCLAGRNRRNFLEWAIVRPNIRHHRYDVTQRTTFPLSSPLSSHHTRRVAAFNLFSGCRLASRSRSLLTLRDCANVLQLTPLLFST